MDNFSELSLPQLRARMARLSPAQLAELRDYESAHGRRLPVLNLLENRIAKLAATG